jgi:hypothetical protein
MKMVELYSFLGWLAELFQGAFILSLPVLTLWLAFSGDQKWNKALITSAWLGLIGAALGLCHWLIWYVTFFMSEPGSTGWARPHPWTWWVPMVLHLIPILVFMFGRNRRSWWTVWAMGLVVMLCVPSVSFERFVIVITSLHRDYLPSSWTLFHAHTWFYAILPVAIVFSAVLGWWAKRRALNRKTNSPS